MPEVDVFFLFSMIWLFLMGLIVDFLSLFVIFDGFGWV